MRFGGLVGAARCSRLSRTLLGAGLALSLAGCETSPGTQAGRLDVRAAIARGEIRSPKSVGVAMASLEGPPAALTERLKRDIASEGASREITFTDPALARYLVRGYLDAYASEGKTSIHAVWDVYDAVHQRARRLDDAFDLPSGPDGDVWSGLNDETLATIAARGADDLALFLAEAPEPAAPTREAAAGPTPDGKAD